MKGISAIILAAGQGKRMKSSLPKVAHLVLGKPVVWHVAQAARAAGIREMVFVLGYGRGQVWKVRDLVARYSEAQEGSPVTLTYSRREIRDLVARYGFRVRELFVEHIFPYRIPEYVRYEYKRTWYFQAMPRPLFRWLETHLGWHLCVTAVAEAGHGSAAAR